MEAALDILKAAADWIGAEFSTLGSKLFGILIGAAVSWLVFLRRKARALDRLASGQSDDILYQAHHLHPLPGGNRFVLLFRNLCPKLSVNDLYDNLAAREEARRLAKVASLKDPILPTTGRMGFEILNDAFNHLAGSIAGAPLPREQWLFAMTSEDRKVTRKECIRCFLIKPEDLERFADWGWCRRSVLCEQAWHWFRVVALHQIAMIWKAETAQGRAGAFASSDGPLVDDQSSHRRVRSISAGIYQPEIPIAGPCEIAWASHAKQLGEMGLKLEIGGEHPAPPQPETLDRAEPR